MQMLKSPRPGDILYVNRGFYKHYGVYAGDDKVIHFAPYSGNETSAENAIVHETTLEAFLKGGELKIAKKSKANFSSKEIVSRAKSQIGSKGYSLVFRNCENFARWCRTGVSESKQVDDVIDIVSDVIGYGLDVIRGNPDQKKVKKLDKKLSDFLK
jgi:hypothetical protein